MYLYRAEGVRVQFDSIHDTQTSLAHPRRDGGALSKKKTRWRRIVKKKDEMAAP
jgi:hypothetical protein